MPQSSDHATHPYRKSDAAVMFMMVATIVSSMWVTYWSIIHALGSGLGSTPDTPVPPISNVLWGMSGYAILLCFVLFVATLVTRRRAFSIALALVVLGAGLALTAGRMINWYENDSAMPVLEALNLPVLIVPLVASAVIFWKSRGLLPWGANSDTE